VRQNVTGLIGAPLHPVARGVDDGGHVGAHCRGLSESCKADIVVVTIATVATVLVTKPAIAITIAITVAVTVAIAVPVAVPVPVAVSVAIAVAVVGGACVRDIERS
jgi:hypothetical protein